MNALATIGVGHVLLGVASMVVGRRLGRWVFVVAGLGPGATLIWAGLHTSQILDGRVFAASVGWVPGLDLHLAVRVDAFSLVMLWLIGAIGALVCVYCAAYFSESNPRLGSFAAMLTAFAGSMVGLVIADDVFLLFVFWELTSVTSYLLIGFNHHDVSARSSALQALLTTVAGGLALLGGLVILASQAGTTSMNEILASRPDGALVSIALVLVIVGAAAKSAQFPLHFWLPGAMAAPTPVSAFLHSATMVNAGIYLVARFGPSFADVAIWRPLVAGIGVASMLVGACTALRRTDLKQILAYGTISQLGLLFVLFGFGDSTLTTAGVGVLIAHAVYKAAMFMVVGVVDHRAGTRDIDELSGLGRAMPALAGVALVAGASMASLPPLLGFAAKEQAISALLALGGSWGVGLVVAVGLSSILTVAYTGRVLWGAFATKPGRASTPLHVADSARLFLTPIAVLAAIGVVVGLAPRLVTPLLDLASASLIAGGGEKRLLLWPGLNAALVVSLGILLSGVALVAGRDRVDARLARVRSFPSGDSAFAATVSGLLRAAERITGTVQSGSLPAYLVVILLTAATLPATAMVGGGSRWPGDIPLADSPIQAVTGALIVVCAVAAAVVRQRIAAVLALGAVGLGVGVLFIIEGGPDLALTQLLVETVVIVAFALVFRLLPRNFRQRQVQRRFGQARTAIRLTTAGLVGASITALALSAAAASTGSSTRTSYLEQAGSTAGGRNVVNTILVDFRALDTLGEITVLTVAALGVLSLAHAAQRRPADMFSAADGAAQPSPLRSGRRAPLLETGVDLIFHTIVIFALYLLFAGHNQPGGGFIAGLVTGAAFAVRHLAGRTIGPRREPRPEMILGCGLAVAVATAIGALVLGDELLESGKLQLELPLLGTVKVFSVLLFDIGVFLIVVGLVLSVLDALGRGADSRPADHDTIRNPVEAKP